MSNTTSSSNCSSCEPSTGSNVDFILPSGEKYLNKATVPTAFVDEFEQFIEIEQSQIDLSVHSIELLPKTKYLKDYYSKRNKNEDLTLVPCQDQGIRSKMLTSLSEKKALPLKSIFCGAQADLYIFDAYGEVFTCWELVGESSNKIGTYNNDFNIDPSEANNWFGKNISEVESCSKCKYAFFCGGGCISHALKDDKGYRSSYCEEYPSMFHISTMEAYKEHSESDNKVNLKIIKELCD